MNRRRQKLHRQKASKQAHGAPESIIINKVEVVSVDRKPKEVPDWKDGIKQAESPLPNRRKLYSLHNDMELDGQVEAVTEKVNDAVTLPNYVCVDAEGVEVEAINQLTEGIGFEDMIKEIPRSYWWGYSMLELRFRQNSDNKWEMFTIEIPKQLMRPHLGRVAYNDHTDEGIDIRSQNYPAWIMEIGKEKSLGKFAIVAPYVLLYRSGMADWATVIQNFGEPILDALWDGIDEKARAQLSDAIKNRGPGGAIIRPKGTELKMHELINSNGDLQDKFMKACLALISKVILGTTETTDSSDSSGYAQAQTHQNQDENKYARFHRSVLRVLNGPYMRILKANGFTTKGCKWIIKGEEKKLPLQEAIKIHLALKNQLALPIEDDYLYEYYNIPKPDNYDELKEILTKGNIDPNPVPDPKKPKPSDPPPEDPPEGDPEEDPEVDPEDPEDEPPKKPKKPKKTNLSIGERFIQLCERFFVSAPAQVGACGTHHITLSDSDQEGQTLAGTALIREISKRQGMLKVSLPMLESTAKILLDGFRQGMASAPRADRVELIDGGFEYGTDDPALMTAYELNMFRFSAAKNLAEVQELNALFRRSDNFREFEELAQATLDNYNRRWMLTEFNTATNTGEARATFERLMSKTDLFPYWKYVTIGDDKVRDEHSLLDGLILKWDDSRWAKLFPPNGWNCRCYIVPVMAHELPKGYSEKKAQARADRFFKSKEFKRQNAQGWGVNRAAIGEIFTANQQYLYKQPGKSSKALNKLKATDYGLPSFSKMKAQASGDIPAYSGAASDFFSDQEVRNDHTILRDLRKRQIRISGEVAEATATDSDKLRNLSALQESLSNPDEIWINGSSPSEIDQYVYIRYYQDEAMITVASLSNLELVISDWFTLSGKQLGNYRRGILIKNNTTNGG